MRRIGTTAGGAVLVGALMLALAACGGGDKKADEKAAPKSRQTVSAVTVSQVNLPRLIAASGSVSAWQEVPIAAETGGLTAVAVYVDEGAYVRQGQPLVQMNTVLLDAQVRQQRAAVQQAAAAVARDDAALDRAQELKGRGFLSQASLDQALATQRASQANLAAARASLAESQTRQSQATIRAPVSGLIISRSVVRGQIIAAGTELFRMVREGRLELDAQVPEADLPAVRAGQAAAVVSDHAGATTGVVRIVTAEVDPQTRLGVARISLAGGSGLRPGMFARATINAGAAPALTVPSEAVVFREGKAGVYVVGQNGAVHFTLVNTGVRTNGQVAVTGVTAGQRVVTRGAGFLGDGDLVTVAAANAPTRATPAAAAPTAAR